jgi:hypothetical protein
MIDHLTHWNVRGQTIWGDNRSTNFDLLWTYRIKSEVVQSLSRDNVFVSDFRGSYLQGGAARRQRQTTFTQSSPQTLNGLTIQQTFVGPCSALDPSVTDPNKQCSFLPGLITDRTSIDPDFLVPTRILQLNSIGTEVSAATLANIKQPGFQNGSEAGQMISVDLFFPNIGSFAGNSQSNQTTIDRQEDIDDFYTLGFYRVR